MKKLIILPSETGTIFDTNYNSGCDVYLTDTNEMLNEGCWFINSYGHVNYLSQDIPHYEVHTGKPNQVIIASTQSNLGLDSIPQFIIDKFLENTELDWLVDFGTTGTGEFVTLCSSDNYTTNEKLSGIAQELKNHLDSISDEEFLNEWETVDTTLDLGTFSDEDLDKFEIIEPDFPITTEHLDAIIVNGQTLIPAKYGDWWVTNNNETLTIGDLWYQPNSKSRFYPDDRGRLLQFCKSEDLESSPGFDDWAEIQINSINGFYN